MGCGISTMEESNVSTAQLRRYNGRFRHQHSIVPQPQPSENINKKYIDDDNVDDDINYKKVTKKEEMVVFSNNNNDNKLEILEEYNNISNGHKNVTKYEDEEINSDKDDIVGPGSPSFREYCNDNRSIGISSMREYNDNAESRETTKNNRRDDDSTKAKNKKVLPSNKGLEKKERRGRGGFRNVMYKGKARGGKRNFLNFGCYNSSTQSYAEGSFNKVVAKTR